MKNKRNNYLTRLYLGGKLPRIMIFSLIVSPRSRRFSPPAV